MDEEQKKQDDYMNEMKDIAAKSNIHGNICPHCGYCPTCGRPYGNWNYPPYPGLPYYPGPYFTCSVKP